MKRVQEALCVPPEGDLEQRLDHSEGFAQTSVQIYRKVFALSTKVEKKPRGNFLMTALKAACERKSGGICNNASCVVVHFGCELCVEEWI